MSEQEEALIVTLEDDNGEEFEAELYDSVLYDGHVYNLFIPVAEEENEEAPVIIMEYSEEGDDVILTPVENEVLLDEIWEAYNEEVEEEEK